MTKDMEEDKQKGGVVHNHFEAGSNCQVFNREVRDCVFAMPGSTVNQYGKGQGARDEGQGARNEGQGAGSEGQEARDEGQGARNEGQERDEELTLFVHPAVESGEWQVHDQLKRLVKRHGMQEICQYLTQLREENKVLLPLNAEKAYNELVRLGMPHGEGYTLKTFTKYYKR